MTNAARLPHFSDPPVHQVVLGVAFEPLLRLRASHVGLFWQEINRDRAYPRVDELTPNPVAIERLDDSDGEDDSLSGAVEVMIAGVNAEQVPRIVLSSADLSRQVAIQRDSLQVSWRRAGDSQYPRYETVKDQFLETLSVFEKFLADQSLGRLLVRQAEISYGNAVGLRRNEIQGDAERLVEFRLMHGHGIPKSDHFHTYQRHTLEHAGAAWGRLYITFDSAGPVLPRSDAREREQEMVDGLLSFSLLGPTKSRDNVVRFLDRAHDVIVDAFVATITPHAEKTWGRLYGGQP
jgi:hypothetical protein